MKDLAEVNMPVKPLSVEFSGSVTFMLIDSIASVISERLDAIENNISVKKRVFGVVMECLQNLGNHAIKADINQVYVEYDPSSVGFKIENTNDGYEIVTVNFLQNCEIQKLKEWIEMIKCFTPEQIRKKYNDILLHSSFNEKRGGGLGLLDVALRSNGEITYKFKPFNDNYSLFYFKTVIKK